MHTLYAVLPSSVNGLGCFSMALIPKGTLILVEKPLFAVREPRNNAAVTSAFSRLPTTSQAQYLTLHAQHEHYTPAGLIVDIFNTNAWQTESRTSILIAAARFNHSCVPNAVFAWNARLTAITVRAIVDIPTNAEIYLSYEPPYQTLATRRAKLAAYGFGCACSACGAEASKTRRARMVQLDARIRVARRQKWSGGAPRAAMELVKLLKEEGLVGDALGLACHDAAVGWRRYGRLDVARRYALKELEVVEMCYGLDSPYIDTSRAYIEDLREGGTQSPAV